MDAARSSETSEQTYIIYVSFTLISNSKVKNNWSPNSLPQHASMELKDSFAFNWAI
jgi:hypothetical protein